MGGVTIGKTLLHGFAGRYAQQPDMIIDTEIIDGSSDNVYFGEAVIDTGDGTVTKADAGATAANFVGVACAEVKTVPALYDDQNAGGFYAALEAAAIFKRGIVSVVCNVGSPAKNGVVYLRTVIDEEAGNIIIGGFEAEDDSEKVVEITNCAWGSTADANGVAALVLKTRNTA
jgi:hypothetical protein